MTELALRARSLGRASAMAALTATMLPPARFHSGLKTTALEQRETFRRWERVWAEQLLRLFGMRLHVIGHAPSGPKRPRLVVANHRSPVDILIAVARVGGCVLSRSDLSEWPLLGPAAKAAGTIFVDREDRRSGASAIREIRARLKGGDQVVVFPEGRTSAGDEVRPFQGGAFTAAKGLEVEVLPLGLAYPPGCEFTEPTFTEHMLRVSQRKRTDIGLCIGDPYLLSGGRDEQARTAREVVQQLVHKARSACVS